MLHFLSVESQQANCLVTRGDPEEGEDSGISISAATALHSLTVDAGEQ